MTIVEELRTDRESGARRLEAEYKAGLMSLARRFCADEGDAEELVNRTLAAVVDGIDDYLEQSAFFGWMCQILTNLHAKDVRRKSNRNEFAGGDAVEGPDAADDGAVRIFRDVDAGLLREAVESLPKDMREAVVLHYFLDQPIVKIAKVLAVPPGTVKSRLHYARLALAAKLGTQRPGARMMLLALLLAAGLAIGRGVYALASAAIGSHAESAEFVDHPAPTVPTVSTVSTLSTVSTASTVQTVQTVLTLSTQEPSEMNAKSLLAATSLALAAAPAAADQWVYDAGAKTLSRGTVVLQNVVANGTSLTIKNNKSNATAVDVDLSEGVADGYEVVKIDDDAFNGNSSITNVVFPDTLVTLGNGAFRSCANLACAISLPSSLAGSLSWTFRESPVTGDVVVPNGVTTMKETFYKTKITSLVCGTGLTAVQGGDGLCQSCTTLTNVVFQSGCSLGQNEFYGCSALERVTLHPAMSGAWIQTFKNCSSLTGDIVLPRGVTGMKETFMNAKITSFETVSTNLVYIGYQTNGDGDFSNCRTLTNIVLHAGLKTIGTRVFNNCTGLTEIVLPDTVETFTASFSSCSSLKRVVMPKKLATIGSRVFYGRPTEVYWGGYPKNGFTFGGTDTRDPMWDVYTANVVTNWIRLADKPSWQAAAEAYPDYVSLPPEQPRGAAGWWKGGYRSSAKTILRWWYEPGTLILVK